MTSTKERMSRKHRKPALPMTVILSATGPTRLVPASAAGECVMCTEHRLHAGRMNYTEIYAKRGEVRYCRCKVCGHTWKVLP